MYFISLFLYNNDDDKNDAQRDADANSRLYANAAAKGVERAVARLDNFILFNVKNTNLISKRFQDVGIKRELKTRP